MRRKGFSDALEMAAVVLAIARADFRQRTRQRSLLAFAAAALYAGTLVVPGPSAPYFALDLSGHRGTYNSAWVSGASAFVVVTLLAFAGLFPVRVALERDRLLRTGEIVAASPVSRTAFALGKWLSNVAFLAAACALVVGGAVAMQLLRGEDHRLDALRYGTDFLLIVLPFCALVGAVAVLFETLAPLRGALGGIVYVSCTFWLCLALSALPLGGGVSLDPLGFATLLDSMSDAARRAFGLAEVSQQLIGLKAPGAAVATFVWNGVAWNARTVGARAACFALALAVALFAANRFDRYARAPSDGAAWLPGGPARRFPAAVAASPVAAELAVTLTGTGIPLSLIAGVAVLASSVVPLALAWRAVAPVLAILPLLAWSSLAVRDARCGADELVAAAARSDAALVRSRWIAGTLAGLLPWLPLLLRTLLGGGAATAGATILAVAALAACALALGRLTRSPHAFEGAFLAVWFLGLLNHLPVLDFVAALTTAPYAAAAVAAAAASAALALALGAREAHR